MICAEHPITAMALARGVPVPEVAYPFDAPGARFLHIHRAGEEAALSMREHHFFRLGIMLANGLPPDPEAVQKESDPISQRLASRPDAVHFGRWWTHEVLRGFRALPGLDAAQIRQVRFEDLVEEPRAVLHEVAHFLQLPDPNGPWCQRAVALVRGRPPTRADKLPEDERQRLVAACHPGNFLLGRA